MKKLILLITMILLSMSETLTAKQFILLDEEITWRTDGTDKCFTQRGPENWIEPDNFIEGTIYFRLEIKSKPTSKQIFVQMCIFQNGWQTENCADGIILKDEGVYYKKLERSPIEFWKKNDNSLDWTKPFSHVCFAVKDSTCEGRLMQYTDCGEACYEKIGLEQHLPIQAHATIVVVSKGSPFDPPKEWTQSSAYAYQPQPEKAGLMIVAAHPDDEVYNFGGAITYYSVVCKLPVILICMTSSPPIREHELRCACWKYGMRNKPIFARFADCCYGGTVEENWEQWGGRDKVVAYLTAQIRKYKPDVLLGHDLKGELREHPNHIASALALIDAYHAAHDPKQFSSQLDRLELWQPQKLYLHFYPENAWDHLWTMTSLELNGKTVQKVADEGIRCHVSQNAKKGCKDNDSFGLFYSKVGLDVKKINDFFENIDLSIYREK